MADRLALREYSRMNAVCIAPSINWTPSGPNLVPLPYQVSAQLDLAKETVKEVRFNKQPAFVLKSLLESCTGDGRGVKKGFKSNTLGGEVKPIAGSLTVRAGGSPIIREGDRCWMQGGNTMGIFTASAPPVLPPRPGSPPPATDPPLRIPGGVFELVVAGAFLATAKALREGWKEDYDTATQGLTHQEYSADLAKGVLKQYFNGLSEEAESAVRFCGRMCREIGARWRGTAEDPGEPDIRFKRFEINGPVQTFAANQTRLIDEVLDPVPVVWTLPPLVKGAKWLAPRTSRMARGLRRSVPGTCRAARRGKSA